MIHDKLRAKDQARLRHDRILTFMGRVFEPPAWEDATKGDLKRYFASQVTTMTVPWLTDFMFHQTKPQLRAPVDQILSEMSGFSTTEQILARVVLDIWGEFGDVQLTDIVHHLDPLEFESVITALVSLRERG